MKVKFNSLIATVLIPVSAILAKPAYSQSKVMIHHEVAMGTEFQMYLLSKEPVFQGDAATTYLVKLESTTNHGDRDVEPALVVCSNQLGPEIVRVDNYDGNYTASRYHLPLASVADHASSISYSIYWYTCHNLVYKDIPNYEESIARYGYKDFTYDSYSSYSSDLPLDTFPILEEAVILSAIFNE